MGRKLELAAIAARLAQDPSARIALVGGGGSGKSVLAAAVGHFVRRRYPGGVHWFRLGAWDATTLFEMLARRLGIDAQGTERIAALNRRLAAAGSTLVVLDNHESDRALAKFLDALRAAPVTWLITARRCLLSGVEIFPVVPPLVHAGRSAFPRVAALTKLLRWNPLALDIADRLVATRAVSLADLRTHLVAARVDHISVMRNEDDVAEVRALVDWAWPRLPEGARRMLSVLAHCEGDDMDAGSLRGLAGGKGRPASRADLRALSRWHLVQEPLAGRFTLHAVVRQSVAGRRPFAAARYFSYYVRMLERHPARVDLEQTHLFAAMDHAHRESDLAAMLRVERLLGTLDEP